MHSAGSHTSRPPRWRRGALVLVLWVGLLGMHALGPVGDTGDAGHGGPGQHTVAAGTVAQDGCANADRHCGGGRPRHADPTCASGAVNGGPELPALVPDPVAVAAPDRCPRSRAATGPEGARAPPSLAELQLLRI